jgi:hypothetical protein
MSKYVFTDAHTGRKVSARQAVRLGCERFAAFMTAKTGEKHTAKDMLKIAGAGSKRRGRKAILADLIADADDAANAVTEAERIARGAAGV